MPEDELKKLLESYGYHIPNPNEDRDAIRALGWIALIAAGALVLLYLVHLVA